MIGLRPDPPTKARNADGSPSPGHLAYAAWIAERNVALQTARVKPPKSGTFGKGELR
jgi:hypothetical protein